MEFFAILASVPFESDKILAHLRTIRTTKIAGKTVYKGKLSNLNLLLMNTGIGKVNAAHSATCIIENFRLKCIVNTGVAGAYPQSGLKIGDIAVASKEIYGDEGVITLRGWSGVKEIGIPLVLTEKEKYFNEFPLSIPSLLKVDTTLVDSYRGFRRGRGDFQIKSGNFITVSTTTGTQKRAIELERRFNAICENMEGAAIAQVCTIYKIPMFEVRGISNIAGVRNRKRWNLKLASGNCQKMVLKIIDYLF